MAPQGGILCGANWNRGPTETVKLTSPGKHFTLPWSKSEKKLTTDPDYIINLLYFNNNQFVNYITLFQNKYPGILKWFYLHSSWLRECLWGLLQCRYLGGRIQLWFWAPEFVISVRRTNYRWWLGNMYFFLGVVHVAQRQKFSTSGRNANNVSCLFDSSFFIFSWFGDSLLR